MSGRPPKARALVQRRNRATSRAMLPRPGHEKPRRIPPLHDRKDGWNPRVLAWWRALWRSPMAGEYLESDRVGGLDMLADLYQLWMEATSTKLMLALSAEIRLQEARFGLDPMARRRLQWEIAREAREVRAQSRPREGTSRRRRDPRKLLAFPARTAPAHDGAAGASA